MGYRINNNELDRIKKAELNEIEKHRLNKIVEGKIVSKEKNRSLQESIPRNDFNYSDYASSNADSTMCMHINRFLSKKTDQLYKRDVLANKIAGIKDPLKSLGYGSTLSVVNDRLCYAKDYFIGKHVIQVSVSVDKNNNIDKSIVGITATRGVARSINQDFYSILEKAGQDKDRFDIFVDYLKDVNAIYNEMISKKSKKR